MTLKNIKIGGTPGSPRSEIVRYKRNAEVVSLVNFAMRRFSPVFTARYLRRNVLSGACITGVVVSPTSASPHHTRRLRITAPPRPRRDVQNDPSKPHRIIITSRSLIEKAADPI